MLEVHDPNFEVLYVVRGDFYGDFFPVILPLRSFVTPEFLINFIPCQRDPSSFKPPDGALPIALICA